MFLKKLKKKIIFFKEDNPEISIAIVAAIFLLMVSFAFIKFIEFDSGLSQNLYATLLGFFLDVLLFGILIVLINKKREKKLDIKRWQEEIKDYRGWDEKEAMFRIVGNIRRLNNLGVPYISLSYCFLKGAHLQDADLGGADLVAANLQGASLEDAFLADANLEGAILEDANLEGAILEDANLEDANLEGADLIGANLMGANLQGADIRRISCFTIEQLAEAKTMYMAKMDPDLEKEVREKHPRLLEKPKDEEENPKGPGFSGR